MNRRNKAVVWLLLMLIFLTPVAACRNQPTGTVNTSTDFTPSPGDTVQQLSGLMVIMTQDDLVGQADSIAVGKVVEIQEPRWTNEHTGIRTIYTDVIIKPERFLLGFKADRIAVRVPGGRVGATSMMVEDQPEFNLGEEMLLFLSRPVDLNLVVPEGIVFTDYYNVTGALQGKWSYDKGRVTDSLGNTQDLAAIERLISDLKPETQSSEFVTPSHEGTPLIYMERNYLMQGKVSRLSLYEDGTVILSEDLHLRMPIAPILPICYWFTGSMRSEDRNELIQYLKDIQLNDSYISGGTTFDSGGLTGFSTSDIGLTIEISLDGLNKTVTSMGYYGAEDMPVPLGDVYAKLTGITYGLKFVGSQPV